MKLFDYNSNLETARLMLESGIKNAVTPVEEQEVYLNAYNIISDFINVENKNQCFDELSKYTLQRYEVQDKTDSVQKVIEWEFWFNVCYGIFILFEGCRFIHKVYVRIKNTYRRNIAVGEIGEENLQAILKEYRDKDRKERKRKKKEIDI